MKNSLRIATGGIMCALSVILLYLGSLIWLFAYFMPLLAGLTMIILLDFGGKKLAFTVYAATSLISLIALEDKESVLTYILFFGYYPIIRTEINKISGKVLKTVLKLLLFNAAMISTEIICVYVFMIPFDNELGKWGIPVLLVLSNFVFIVYEPLLRAVEIIYKKKLKHRIDKYFS